MKTFLLALLVATAAVTFAEDNCFDEEKGKAEWISIKDACKAEVPQDAEERIFKMFACMYKKTGILSEDGKVLDYEGKYKTAMNDAKAKDLTHVIEEMDGCWSSSNHEVAEFFQCWGPKLMALCPDSKKWTEDL